jgi:hypothetical protein
MGMVGRGGISEYSIPHEEEDDDDVIGTRRGGSSAGSGAGVVDVDMSALAGRGDGEGIGLVIGAAAAWPWPWGVRVVSMSDCAEGEQAGGCGREEGGGDGAIWISEGVWTWYHVELVQLEGWHSVGCHDMSTGDELIGLTGGGEMMVTSSSSMVRSMNSRCGGGGGAGE